jgi:hypothetical protein
MDEAVPPVAATHVHMPGCRGSARRPGGIAEEKSDARCTTDILWTVPVCGMITRTFAPALTGTARP